MEDRSNGYEEHAETFVRWRHPGIGLDVVRSWAGKFQRNAAILELGCGHGVVSQVLVDAGLILYTVDSSPTLLHSFRQRFPGVASECAAAEDSTYFGLRYDGILAIGLIFLLSQEVQRQVLAKAARALKAGGHLLFTAPRQACTWRDDVTGRESHSLGAAEYERLLRKLGVTMEVGCVDEGENYYHFASKPS